VSTFEPVEKNARDVAGGVRRGGFATCPGCGEGKLFDGFLKVAESCAACGEALHHHRADDAPAYLTILVVGHVFLPVVLGVEELLAPPIWVHALLWGTTVPALCLALLRPIKGMIVGLQWATFMHGFGDEPARSDA
jgi:uncharacterized protein (DUF983 family)